MLIQALKNGLLVSPVLVAFILGMDSAAIATEPLDSSSTPTHPATSECGSRLNKL